MYRYVQCKTMYRHVQYKFVYRYNLYKIIYRYVQYQIVHRYVQLFALLYFLGTDDKVLYSSSRKEQIVLMLKEPLMF